MTVSDMYNLFLGRIQKKSKRSVWPRDFNRVINVAYREWLEMRVDELEQDQKRMDDLSPLHFITDSTITIQIPNVGDLVLAPLTPANGYFEMPEHYPIYYRLMSAYMDVEVAGVQYKGIYTKVLKSNLKMATLFQDPYRLPMVDVHDLKRSRLYLQPMNKKFKIFVPGDAVPKSLVIEYIKDPDDIYFDVGGVHSVDCELDDLRAAEVVELAVRKFMEEVESPRYQTALNENSIDNQFN